MKGKRILTIDDEPGFTKLVKLHLQQTGRFEVQTENDATQALATARQFQPDLILLDIIMPGRDGVELLTALQAETGLPQIPIILLTASMTRHVARAQQAALCRLPVIAKPVKPKVLIRHIDEAL